MALRHAIIAKTDDRDVLWAVIENSGAVEESQRVVIRNAALAKMSGDGVPAMARRHHNDGANVIVLSGAGAGVTYENMPVTGKLRSFANQPL